MRKVDNASQSAGGSFNNYQFDFGLGGSKSSSNAPLKDQKPSGSYSQPWSTPVAPKAAPSHTSTGWSPYQSSTTTTSSSGWASQSKPAGGPSGGSSWGGGGSSTTPQTWAGYKPMTQPVGRPSPMSSQPLGGMNSMNAAANPSYRSDNVSKFAAAGIAGVTESKSADVFGDLLGAALNRSNTPLNKVAPKTSYSMGNLGAALPKNPEEFVRQATPPLSSSKSTESFLRNNVSPSAGGSPFPDISGKPSSSFSDDVFGFGRSSSAPPPAASVGSADAAFGFGGSSSSTASSGGDPFAFGSRGKNAIATPQAKASSAPMADPFDVFAQKQTPSTHRKIADPMDAFFTKSTAPTSKSPPSAPAAAADDSWGMFGGGSTAASRGGGGSEPSTTELEGLPPPPGGVTAESACEKGSDFYKNGQFPDAIKWLTWSMELAAGDKGLSVKVLTCRGSCFKEIGEMKKAVEDCSKAIALKPNDTTLIMQRASLYESMEKYKLGVADLKMVTKLDPSNRLAVATLVRLQKMLDQYFS
ncbi:hypothetical protein Mp_1g04890 [Marchantia polymorpha subsp. ruderalis]|uniref:Uncharacterized protein n=2 Tax=Marchantia polymorpha TaxID=3197 RepID=A0AAF6ALL1_MARPO|nr:hypothetical protein MARPO_0005s0119 [Marchantia polymorpha]BBM97331.1 hypothetical protein Mp_1g04890 [Marchantia polymorpha subsp. ruderalis]|eukprot:PTQ48476.1 hypothetical protein MARPO_0005s0119 [Marchantia polymorpha]